MINGKLITTAIFGGAYVLGSSNIIAQSCNIEYTTEWQTDFSNNYDWLNLLKVNTEIPVVNNLAIEASTISFAKTANESLVSDMLTYSNIEADNLPLTFSRLGLNLSIKKALLFAGINNVNEDYFTSDITSFFTNSSFGISPTISCNFDIANYPLAAWCIHYRQQAGNFSFQTSLYPAKGYSNIFGHDNIFNINIKRNGIFSISSIDYTRNDFYCVLGIPLNYGVCMGDEDSEQITQAQTVAQTKTLSASPWILSEFCLPHNLGISAHASFSTVKNGCKAYAGIGLLYQNENFQPGVAVNYASFSYTSEFAVEITCRVPLKFKDSYIQPALHVVSTDTSSPKCVAMLRLNMSI